MAILTTWPGLAWLGRTGRRARADQFAARLVGTSFVASDLTNASGPRAQVLQTGAGVKFIYSSTQAECMAISSMAPRGDARAKKLDHGSWFLAQINVSPNR